MTVTNTEGSALQDDQMRELVDHAMALEADGDLDGAIGAYEQALMSGYTTDEVCYNLALLYKQQLLYEDALTLLGRCLDSPEYGASAHYASAECQLALGNFAAAADHFDAAIARIALDQVPDDQVPDVRQMFQVAIDTFRSLDREDRAAELRAVLDEFLAAHGAPPTQASPPAPPSPVAPASYAPAQPAPPVGPLVGPGPVTTGGAGGWTAPSPEPGRAAGGAPATPSGDLAGGRETQARPLTQRLRSTYRRLTTALEQEGRGTGLLGRTGQVGALDASRLLPPQTPGTGRIAATYIRRPVRLTPILPLAGEAAQPPAVRALLERAAADLEAGRYDAAVDDCQQAITEAPDYLPAHLRLAEAYAGQGLLTEAAAKCRFLLQVYEARQEVAPTMPVLRLLGAVEQDDLEAWTRMAELYFTHSGHPGLRPTIHALVERADRQGQTELALEYAERLIEHSRDDDEARRLAAALQLRGGNPNRALTYYQTLLRRDHNDMVATAGANVALTIREGALHWPSLERLVSLLRQGGPANDGNDGADDTRRRCLALYRQIIPTAERAVEDLYVAAGLAHLAAGDSHAALGYLDAGQGAEAHFDANGRFVLAYALTQAYRGPGGDATAERHWLERASELLRDPGVGQFAARTALFGAPISAGTLHADLAESMLRTGQVDEALAMLQRLTEEHPDDVGIRYAVAAAYQRQGKLGQALNELDALANQQLNAGKLVEMAETLRKMSEFAGDNLAVKSRLAELFLKRGFPDEALREFDRIAAIHQSRGRNQEAAETLRRAADTAWMIGRQQEAFALYDRVLELAPDNVMLRQAYINCLLQGGQQSAAADQQRAIARTFIEQRRIQESIAALHQVIVLDPRDAEAYNRLGEALASVGEYAQAERVYRRLVRLTPDDPLAKARQTAMAMLVREQGAGAS